MADGPTSAQMQARATNWTPRCARSCSGISARIPARHFGSNARNHSNSIRSKTFRRFDDLKLFGFFEDDWLRAHGARHSPVGARGYADKPVYIFETGGTTGIPKSRIVIEDHWIDYEQMSETLPEDKFPRGSHWLMLGPSGPRRLRLAIEHLAQYRGGICFCVDLDPRWVVRLIKDRRIDEVNRYKEHCIDQAIAILAAGHNIKCMFTTPKLLEALDEKLRAGALKSSPKDRASRTRRIAASIADAGITGIFSGGTEFTPQFTRFAMEEILENRVYMTPTYGNTLMGLACSRPVSPDDGYKITYYAPQPAPPFRSSTRRITTASSNTAKRAASCSRP